MARVFGITASSPNEPERLLGVEVTHAQADERVATALTKLATDLLPAIEPGASVSVLFRRGSEDADPPQSTSYGSFAINDRDQRQSWDFTVAPYTIEPEEAPL